MNGFSSKEWRRAVESIIRQQIRDEAQKCGLVLSPTRFIERRERWRRVVTGTAVVKEVLPKCA